MLAKYFLGSHERYVKKPMDDRGFLQKENNRKLRIYVNYTFTNPPFKEKRMEETTYNWVSLRMVFKWVLLLKLVVQNIKELIALVHKDLKSPSLK
jgi:hypothetical protein